MSRLGGLLGTDGDGTQRAVETATPALLSGMADKADQPGGIDALSGMLDAAERSPQADIGGMLNGDSGGLGTGMLDGIFGSDRGGLLSSLAGRAGVGSGAIGKLLPMLAPLVMGVLAKRRAADSLDGAGLARLLGNEKSALDRGGFLGDGVGKIGAAVGAGGAAVGAAGAAASRGGDRVRGGVDRLDTRVGGTTNVDPPRRGGFGWLWWLIGALILLALAALLFSQCSGSDDLTDAAGTAADEVTDAAGDAADEVTDAAGDAADEVTDAAGDAADAVDGDVELQPMVDEALTGAGISGVTATADADGLVTLTGSVADDAARSAAEDAVSGVEGVTSVDNQLEVDAADGSADAEESDDAAASGDEESDDAAASGDEESDDDSAAPAAGSTINELLDLAPITFAVNSAEITAEGQAVLDEAAAYFEANPDVSVEIGGHTDSDGSDASNLTLSQERADSVKAYLESAGIDGGRMTTQGYGEAEPKTENDTDENKAINRRIEFTVQ